MRSIVVAVMLLAMAVIAEAQQPKKIPRVGWLTFAPLTADRTEAFRQGLRELGYVEGKNIVIEWRSANGKWERGPALAEELVRLKVDIIVTGGGGVTRAVKEATSTIPIVMTQSDDPVGAGFVANLARPGGNITGLSQLSPELSGKRLEILKEVVPKLSRVAIFGTSTSPGNPQMLKEVESAAGAFAVTPQYLDVLTAKDIDLHFVQQARDGLTRSLCSYQALSAFLTEKRLQNSRSRAASR